MAWADIGWPVLPAAITAGVPEPADFESDAGWSRHEPCSGQQLGFRG